MAVDVTLTTANNGTPWTCPAGVTKIKVECYAGGGGGGSSSTTKSDGSGAGGGGGSYACTANLTVTPATNYDFVVGAGGISGAGGASANDGGAGGFTWFSSTTTIYAGGGNGGAKGIAGGAAAKGTGGTATYGTVKWSGGDGYQGAAGSSAVGGGGGEGSGGAAAGNNSAGQAGGTGTAGGDGAAGGNAHAVGGTATGNTGGAGGAGHSNTISTALAGGAGAPGKIDISYVSKGYAPADSNGSNWSETIGDKSRQYASPVGGSLTWTEALTASVVLMLSIGEPSGTYAESLSKHETAYSICQEASGAYSDGVIGRLKHYSPISEQNSAYEEDPYADITSTAGSTPLNILPDESNSSYSESATAFGRNFIILGEANELYIDKDDMPGAWRDASSEIIRLLVPISEENSGYTDTDRADKWLRCSIGEANISYTDTPTLLLRKKLSIAEVNASYIDPSPVVLVRSSVNADIGESNAAYLDGVPTIQIGMIRAWRDSVTPRIREAIYPQYPKVIPDQNAVYVDLPSAFRRLFLKPSDQTANWLEAIGKSFASVPAPTITQVSVPPESIYWSDSADKRSGVSKVISEAFPCRIPLEWTAPSDLDLAGYYLYWDVNSGDPYANSLDVGLITSYTLEGLAPGTWYFAVKAYDTLGQFSNYSAELTYTVSGYWDDLDWHVHGIIKLTDSITWIDTVPPPAIPEYHIYEQLRPYIPPESLSGNWVDEVSYSDSTYNIKVTEVANNALDEVAFIGQIPISVSDISSQWSDSVHSDDISPVRLAETSNYWVETAPTVRIKSIQIRLPILINDIADSIPEYIEYVPPCVVPWALRHNSAETMYASVDSVEPLERMYQTLGENGQYLGESMYVAGYAKPIGYIIEETSPFDWVDAGNERVKTVAIHMDQRWHRTWKKHT